MKASCLSGDGVAPVRLGTYKAKSCEGKKSKNCQNCLRSRKEPTQIRAAENITHLREAFRLVHQRYFELGYMRASISGMRFSAFELLPTTRTFVALEKGDVVSTASLVLDTPVGLPSEASFETEIGTLRDRGRVIAEGTMFAADVSRSDIEGKRLSLEVMKHVFQWCNSLEIDDLLLVVNPKHLSFWSEFMGFDVISSVKPCSHVKGNDGFLVRLNMRAIRHKELEPSPMAAKVFNGSKSLSSCSVNHFTLCEDEVLEMIEENLTLLSEMTPAQTWLLGEYYPSAMACFIKNEPDFQGDLAEIYSSYA